MLQQEKQKILTNGNNAIKSSMRKFDESVYEYISCNKSRILRNTDERKTDSYHQSVRKLTTFTN